MGSIWWVQMPPSPEMSAFGTEHRITQSLTLGLPPETCLYLGGTLHTPATPPACAGPAFIPRGAWQAKGHPEAWCPAGLCPGWIPLRFQA